jgi:hypothetical protein
VIRGWPSDSKTCGQLWSFPHLISAPAITLADSTGSGSDPLQPIIVLHRQADKIILVGARHDHHYDNSSGSRLAAAPQALLSLTRRLLGSLAEQ